ncbi:hypothetical protein P4S64_06480 [Vibrio sp. M60_M31a]
MWTTPKSLGIDFTHKLTMQVMFIITLMVLYLHRVDWSNPVLWFNCCRADASEFSLVTSIACVETSASSVLSVVLLSGGQWVVENLFGFDTAISVIINFFGGGYFFQFYCKKNKFD